MTAEPYTPEAAAAEMRKIHEESHGDYEVDHSNADDLLCQALCQLGYEALVIEYEKVGKWYA